MQDFVDFKILRLCSAGSQARAWKVQQHGLGIDTAFRHMHVLLGACGVYICLLYVFDIPCSEFEDTM
jgi:hypothetical protein